MEGRKGEWVLWLTDLWVQGGRLAAPAELEPSTGSKCPFAVPGFSSCFCRQELSNPLTKAQPTPVLWCHASPVILKQQQGRKTPSWCVHPARLRLGAGLSESSRGVTMHSRHSLCRHTAHGDISLAEGPSPCLTAPILCCCSEKPVF